MSADGANFTPTLSRQEIDAMFSRMFDLRPDNFLSWEVFVKAYHKRDGGEYKSDMTEIAAAHAAFVQDPLTCPAHVIEYCHALIAK